MIATIVSVATLCAVSPTSALAFAPPSAPSPGAAQPAPVDEVRLVSGGFIRGEIVEYVPDSHIMIVPRGTNESRRIEWAAISEVVRGGQPEQANPAPAPAPEPAPQPAPQPAPEPAPEPTVEPTPEPTPEPAPEAGDAPAKEGVFIHIEQSRNKEPMVLYHIDGEAVASGGGFTAHAVAYSEICESPCDVEIPDPKGEFFVGGQKKYTASKRFRLPGDSSGYDLNVKPGHRGTRIGGWVLMSSAIVATVFMAAGPYIVDMPKRPHATGIWAGAGLVGAFGIGGGIAMMILGRTRVKVVPRGR